MNAAPATDTPSFFPRLFRSLHLDEIKHSPYGLKPQMTRYPRATIAALLGSWTIFALAIWVGVFLAFIGAIVGFFGAANLAQSYVQGSGTSVGLLGAIAGAGLGFVFGFGLVFGGGLLVGATHVLVALLCGVIFAWAATAFMVTIEPWIMYFHGYRPPSHREERVLTPVIRVVARDLRLRQVPQLLIADTTAPGAWTHTRHIVLSKRLLDLPHAQLAGILIHELRHWQSGDTAGLLYVTMAGMPLTVTVNILTAVRSKVKSPVVALALWLLLWPYLLIIKLIVQPLLAMEGRSKEYEADAAATRAGCGPGLVRALEQLQPFEQSRSGWEDVLHATHPPLEYRIEAIEEDVAAMAQIPKDDLDSTAEVPKIFAAGAQPVPPSRPTPSH